MSKIAQNSTESVCKFDNYSVKSCKNNASETSALFLLFFGWGAIIVPLLIELLK